MNWRVTYRSKDNRQECIFVEAENRTHLFKSLNEKGIRPIKVESASSTKNSHPLGIYRKVFASGLVLSLIVVTFVAIKFISKNENKENIHQIKVDRPKVASKTKATPVRRPKPQTPPTQEKRPITLEERRVGLEAIRNREYKGPVIDMDTYVSADPGFSNRWERFKAEQAKLPFKHMSENAIAVILDTKPGQMILDGEFHPHFVRDFLKSLETPIKPLSSDDEKTAQLKRDMVQAKIILKEAYDRGEDIIELLKEERSQLMKIHALRENLFRELKEVEKSAKSTQEIDEYVKAANMMLDEHGAQHIKLPYSKERFRLEKTEGIVQ